MSQVMTALQALQKAMAMLAANEDPRSVIALISGIPDDHPLSPQTQHLRGVAWYRFGDARRALQYLVDGVRRGERTVQMLDNLAGAAADVPLDATIAGALLDIFRNGGLPGEQLALLAQHACDRLGFVPGGSHTRCAEIFEFVALPLLEWSLQQERMDLALFLDTYIYERYVKARETESHFRDSVARIAPMLNAAGRAWRERLPPPAYTPSRQPWRLGFFVHRASLLAHLEVMINTLKGYRQLAVQPVEPVVYCFSSRHEGFERALADIGVRLVFLDEGSPQAQASAWQRLLYLRERVAADGLCGMVWISLVTKLPLVFGMQIAPVQIWWAMKYHGLELDDIDGYVSGGGITRFRRIDGKVWRNGVLGVDNWYDATQEDEARRLRAQFGDRLVLASIGRTEKLRDPTFLATVVGLLQRNPQCVFLWPGRVQDPEIQAIFEGGGVADRTHFIGWVNTRLYAQVIDVFMDSFPFPSGFTLFQAMAAGKPAVIYRSKESLETGLWAFIGSVLDGEEGTVEDQQQLRDLLFRHGDQSAIGIARTPDEYAACVQRLIDDAEWRGRCGVVSRELMARYLSSPKHMGATHMQHFIDLLAEHYPELSGVELQE